MWLTILKYVAKIAIYTGLAEKGKGWLKDKIGKAADKAEDKAIAKLDLVEEKVDEIDDLLALGTKARESIFKDEEK